MCGRCLAESRIFVYVAGVGHRVELLFGLDVLCYVAMSVWVKTQRIFRHESSTGRRRSAATGGITHTSGVPSPSCDPLVHSSCVNLTSFGYERIALSLFTCSTTVLFIDVSQYTRAREPRFSVLLGQPPTITGYFVPNPNPETSCQKSARTTGTVNNLECVSNAWSRWGRIEDGGPNDHTVSCSKLEHGHVTRRFELRKKRCIRG